MQIPPLAVILSWPTPNYEDPETRGYALMVLMVLFSVLVVLAMAGRFYSRLVVKRWFGWDDSMILLALIFTIGMNAVVILANRKYGWDRHIWDLHPSKIQNANIVAFTSKLLFVAAATFTRVSLICFYYRLVLDSGMRWFRWILHASMSFVVALGVAFTIVGIFLCIPVRSYWVYPPMTNSKCLDEGVTTLIIGIFNCVADLLTTLLPISIVVGLKMPLKQRIGVCFLLCLGILVTVAGIIRTFFIWQSFMHSWDTTWYSYPLWICATIEINVAVLCACAPALKPLLQKPISLITSRLSSKLSSVRSFGQTKIEPKEVSSGARSKRPRSCPQFARRGGVNPIWDEREGTGALHLDEDEKSGPTTVHVSTSESDLEAQAVTIRSRSLEDPGCPHRTPVLEVMRSKTVEHV